MNKNTSFSLGTHFEAFVESRIAGGRFKNASEVIRAGLRLLEEEEHQVAALRKAVQEGIESDTVMDFDPEAHLSALKSARRKHG